MEWGKEIRKSYELNRSLLHKFYILVAQFIMTDNIVPLFILMAFISHLLLTILHEMSHGFFASIFTTKQVSIFIGSYGKTEKNLSFTFGKQRYYIEYNILYWKGGLCTFEAGEMSLFHRMLQILAGPLFPLFIALVFFYIANRYMNEYAYLAAIVFLAVASLSFLVNIFPRQKAVKLKNGHLPNDGYQLLELFRYRKIYKEYSKALVLYNEKKYDEAAKIFKRFIDQGKKDKNLYKLAITSCIMGNSIQYARDILNGYEEAYTPDYDDLINIGYLYSRNDEHELAIKYYKKSLKIQKSWHGYNNIGYQLAETGNYEKALKYLDKAVAINPDHAYPYNNRGLAKIKMGDTEGGLEDINKSYKLDPKNSYYYRSMGIYHFDRGEYETALTFFEQAKSIDAATFKIDILIADAQNKLI